ncbi:MAG: Holliday junction branch migration protein RuvA [Flavobacteriales bacterium]|nr:Holliday junction branch migration protein RuvA [Flavobacteriales bacterium]
MITHLHGVLEEKTPASAVIDCGGIGYLLSISLHTYAQLPDKGTCRLFTHMAIREDAHVLFGFYNRDERELFRQLISVSGVGGNTALAILSGLDPSGVKDTIVSGNVSVLKSIKGVGPKTAERIIVDLRDRMGKVEVGELALGLPQNKGREEALTALITLGFAKNAADKAVDKVLKTHGKDLAVEEIVKHALSSF